MFIETTTGRYVPLSRVRDAVLHENGFVALYGEPDADTGAPVKLGYVDREAWERAATRAAWAND